jgi:hypothetical protein
MGRMRIRIKFTIVLFAILLSGYIRAIAQRDIEPTLIFSDTVNYKFSGEWQYLSTDIYLLNGERFSTLINELDFVRAEREKTKKRPRRTGLSEEYLEYLFITARLKNVRFFGANDVTYPLYNFQISRGEKDDKYQTFVSDNIESIRIIDNLPLYSASDFIDADISVRAITNNDRDQILGLVASQLQNLSKLQTPTGALMGIIGEFGNFIEANTKKKEYRFSSTIRLFEQKNFDTRLHSIRVYALLTGNSDPVLINTVPIKNLLDSADNPKVNRQKLADLISHKQYPLIVVANYKSLYRMEQVTGDEINFANIDKRKLKIENDFRAGLINAETYRQERDFINFITIFANLKNHLEVYSLNYKTGNTDAISGSLFRLLQYYRQLIKASDEIQFKYRGNSTYENVFKSEYKSILGYASLYLNEDHNLKRLQDLAITLVGLESNPNITSVQELEMSITALRFADIFKPIHTMQSVEGQLVKLHLEKLEQQLLIKVFEKEIDKLNRTEANRQNRLAPESLRVMIRNSNCGLCRAKGFDAIDHFNSRLALFNLQMAHSKRDSIVKDLQPWFYRQLQKIQLAKENINIFYADNSTADTRGYLSTKIAEAERDVRNLQDFTRIDLAGKEILMVETLNGRLLSTKRQVEETLELVCNLKPELCRLAEPAAIAQPRKRPTSNVDAFSSNDPVIRQSNVFIAIFEFQLAKVSQRRDLSTIIKHKILQTEESLNSLKVAVDIYADQLAQPEKLIGLEADINNLVKAVSDTLSEIENQIP